MMLDWSDVCRELGVSKDPGMDELGRAVADKSNRVAQKVSAMYAGLPLAEKVMFLMVLEMWAASFRTAHPDFAAASDGIKKHFMAVGYMTSMTGDAADDGTAGPEAHL